MDLIGDPEFEAQIAASGEGLSARALEILQLMIDGEDGEDGDEILVLDHGDGWVGLEQTNSKLVLNLVRAMAIHRLSESENPPGYEMFTITDIGRQLCP